MKKTTEKISPKTKPQVNSTKPKLIVGNWKMNPWRISEADALFESARAQAESLKNTTLVICPPVVFLQSFFWRLSHSGKQGGKLLLGAQDTFWELEGAHTGEISPFMLSSVGAKYVIVGHSERRARGDTAEVVNKKTQVALKLGFTTILCVGEGARDEDGDYYGFIKDQILVALDKTPKRLLKQLVIAYEPLWAIGDKATHPIYPRDLYEMVIFIRKVLSDSFGRKTADEISILYGGSVDETNAEGFLTDGHADGLLVGRASLDAKKFKQITEIAEKL